ncbi:glycosyltransferase [Turicibacter sanguinis]|uniref:glycosyltransferase family 2 protein n=1 Tax=Turicibacter sanguinis TaxID=154288 RepID=UPI0012BBA8CF|nr:glycosyltransferase family 2 protein [Turicibacter sanguinis]MDB8545635.1 glycosyltransferase family 2 protein [Turicibacter sanguinis]MTO10807.1 glycosyltransferase [Turicibacter sanguinis]MTP48342.1 glycosyltransferase [Turicibacter sanguinis]MTP51061.1 glycosyltransferase [Turicibacter sanguinis]MTQ08343.1 glycosyltransferase [Turicibacter sanguinis]
MVRKSNNETSNLLVSIIIPAYNVEKYIEKCITSILEQTYINIEVIIVNDGSTDNTGSIIDNISHRDSRVHIVHKKNTGVSSARNSGIEVSRGEYLVFVDGDDYLAPDYVEYMLSLIKNTDSDFCLSKCCYTKRDEMQTKSEYIEKLQPEDATALLLSPDVIVGCWNKIFKRSLIVDNNIWFSTTLFYGEGLTFITTIAQISKSVGVGNRKVYYYRRNNEASATTKFDINKLYNGEKALKNIGENFILDSPKINIMLKLHMCLFYLGVLVRIRANGVEKEYLKDYRRWTAYIRRNVWGLTFNREISTYRKLMLLGGCISPWVMMKLDNIRRSRISANSVD